MKFALKIPSNQPYFIDCCSAKFTLKILTKIPWNQLIFHEFVPENPAKFVFFLGNLSEALIKMTTILFPMIVQLVELFIVQWSQSLEAMLNTNCKTSSIFGHVDL